MKTNPTHFIELLENRIAPAVFLVSSAGLTIKNLTTNAAATGDAAAQTATGATFALLMVKGDSVAFDANGDGQMGRGDVKLLNVTAGSAMAFFTDANASSRFD